MPRPKRRSRAGGGGGARPNSGPAPARPNNGKPAAVAAPATAADQPNPARPSPSPSRNGRSAAPVKSAAAPAAANRPRGQRPPPPRANNGKPAGPAHAARPPRPAAEPEPEPARPPAWRAADPRDTDPRVNLAPRRPGGLWLANPVLIASGLYGDDGYGKGMPPGARTERLGAVTLKTLTLRPRPGNPEPRLYPASFRAALAAREAALFNSVGLDNPGIDAALERWGADWAASDATYAVSIAGDTLEEWGELASKLRAAPGVAAIELNLSCPNAGGAGRLYAHCPRLTESAVRAVAREAGDRPIWAKLAPNAPDIAEIAAAAVDAGADALIVSNTAPALHIDAGAVSGRQIRQGDWPAALGAGAGGMSGPALRPIAMALTQRVAQAVDAPVIACGGVLTGQHAAAYLLAGAAAVQVGSACRADPRAPQRVLSDLFVLLRRWPVDSVSELTRLARQRWRAKPPSGG